MGGTTSCATMASSIGDNNSTDIRTYRTFSFPPKNEGERGTAEFMSSKIRWIKKIEMNDE